MTSRLAAGKLLDFFYSVELGGLGLGGRDSIPNFLAYTRPYVNIWYEYLYTVYDKTNVYRYSIEKFTDIRSLVWEFFINDHTMLWMAHAHEGANPE